MVISRKEIGPLRPYVPGKPIDDVKREYGLTNVIKIASNENPYGCSEKARNAAVAAFDNMELYPDGNCTILRDKLSKKLGVKPGQIVFGCGADEVITMIASVFVNPGDECITGQVTFPQYASAVISMGGTVIHVPMKNHGFDFDGILQKINSKTKAIFVTNPNNPTGTWHTEKAQLEFMEKIPDNILVVLDEAYSEFCDDPDYPKTFELLKTRRNVVLLKTFSKVYGLASLRVGYGIMDEEYAALFEKIRKPFNVSTAAQAAAVEALEDMEFFNKSIGLNSDVRKYMYEEMDKLGIEYIKSQANFIMINSGKNSRQVFESLMKKGYIIRPGAAFGMETWLRVTIGTKKQMEGFLETLVTIIC